MIHYGGSYVKDSEMPRSRSTTAILKLGEKLSKKYYRNVLNTRSQRTEWMRFRRNLQLKFDLRCATRKPKSKPKPADSGSRSVPGTQTSIALFTFPETSVKRKWRPWNL